jgi:hypothetical protein
VSGVAHILQYNRHYYLAGLSVLLGLLILLRLDLFPAPSRPLLLAGIALAAFWWIGSLAASYYVYDYAGVTRWGWLPATLAFPPRQWLNLHAGLDESSEALTRLFPESKGQALDIYDPVTMTETSIARARRSHPPAETAASAKLGELPLDQCSRDTVFLLLAAHEVRQPGRRVELFREVARVMPESGQALLVEHLRDWKNFLAFGPGFLHFHAHSEWLRVARESGFSVESEGRVTPLVHGFLLRKTGS